MQPETRPARPTIGVLSSWPIYHGASITHYFHTVYVPDDRMGEVSLSQTAKVMVDSFPGETFSAVVTSSLTRPSSLRAMFRLSKDAKKTVFAVKLKLVNASGKLKPGMPTDVSFGTK